MTSLPGVFLSKKKDGSLNYRSSITYKNKHISLGSYDTEEKAHQCYLDAKDIITSGISILDYGKERTLPFDKWVTLINYRDNNYYLKTPIYLSHRYFVYYLSLEEELHFDIEDLFYFSTHRIHKRNGYYFVNDYGMQINILSRFGIKNHAVAGRDYLFVDGNSSNYRYDNIHVINPYYGVIEENLHNKVCYKAYINIKGTYIIGRYEDMTTAAIAYNKSVDFIQKYGISKKAYTKNYITDINSHEYLERYKNIVISKKILGLFDINKIDK